tara:strand:- start:480 stop:824 length:345 start_codon:yes stop_codon:yes gene_type:complete
MKKYVPLLLTNLILTFSVMGCAPKISIKKEADISFMIINYNFEHLDLKEDLMDEWITGNYRENFIEFLEMVDKTDGGKGYITLEGLTKVTKNQILRNKAFKQIYIDYEKGLKNK